MEIIREFAPADRYRYDFEVCTISKGWAQVDTSQDASYFGTWINPTKREVFCYCEGDTILTRYESDAEMAIDILHMKEWNEKQGHRFMGIDPGMNESLKQALIDAGLGGYLH